MKKNLGQSVVQPEGELTDIKLGKHRLLGTFSCVHCCAHPLPLRAIYNRRRLKRPGEGDIDERLQNPQFPVFINEINTEHNL